MDKITFNKLVDEYNRVYSPKGEIKVVSKEDYIFCALLRIISILEKKE